MRDHFQKINQFILDILFPIQCLGCHKEEKNWICQSCFNDLKIRSQQVCPYCQKNITPHGETCFNCHKKYNLDGLFIAGFYKDNLLQKIIHTYKYGFIKNLYQPLGKFLLKAINKQELPLPDLIIPVPLHPYRLRWRGFNQSLLLAQFLSQNLELHYSIPVDNNLIKRIQFTIPQMSISQHQQRENNIKNAFQLVKEKQKSIQNKKIWLIDDVATTGSTLKEVGKVLKQGRAKSVFGIVLARQGKER